MRIVFSALLIGMAVGASLLAPAAFDSKPIISGISEQAPEPRRSPALVSTGSTGNSPQIAGYHRDASTEQPDVVRLNQNLIDGLQTTICTTESGRLAKILTDGVANWNSELKSRLGYIVFATPTTGATSCTGVHIEVLRPVGVVGCPQGYTQGTSGWAGTRACYLSEKSEAGELPRKRFANSLDSTRGDRALLIYQALGNQPSNTAAHVSTMMHELGHALGLTDYKLDRNCTGLRGMPANVPDVDPHDNDFSLMVRSTDTCRTPGIVTERDLRDMYEAYHVGAIVGVKLSGGVAVVNEILEGVPTGPVVKFTLAWGSGMAAASHSASRVAVFRQRPNSSDWTLLGHASAFDDKGMPRMEMDVSDPSGQVSTAHRYKVVGLNRGDIRWIGRQVETTSDPKTWTFDREVVIGGETYTEGDPTFVTYLTEGADPQVLSGSVSPRYCWTDQQLMVSGRASGALASGVAYQGVGETAFTVGNKRMCGALAGRQAMGVEGRWGAAPVLLTREMTIPIHVLAVPAAPIALSMEQVARKAGAPRDYCVSDIDFEVMPSVAGGAGPYQLWIDGQAVPVGQAATIQCPGTGVRDMTVSGLVLDKYGSGATFDLDVEVYWADVTWSMAATTGVLHYGSGGAAAARSASGAAVGTGSGFHYELRKNGVVETRELRWQENWYEFRGLEPDTSYVLGVRLVIGRAATPWLDRTVKTFAHEAPSGVTAVVSGTSATLSWTAAAGLSYQVRQGEDNRTMQSATGGRHAFAGVSVGDTLYVRVAGTGENAADGGSAWAAYVIPNAEPPPLSITAFASPTSCEAGGTVDGHWSVAGAGAVDRSSPTTVTCQSTAGSQSVSVAATDSSAPAKRQAAGEPVRLA